MVRASIPNGNINLLLRASGGNDLRTQCYSICALRWRTSSMHKRHTFRELHGSDTDTSRRGGHEHPLPYVARKHSTTHEGTDAHSPGLSSARPTNAS